MKIIEATGFSKAKAFETTNLETSLDKFRNATISWKKAGSPTSGKALEEFAAAYLKEKKAAGLYLVVTPASDDTRLRPYSVVNEATKGKRKATTVYQVKSAELKVTSTYVDSVDEDGNAVKVEQPEVKVLRTGAVEGRAPKKDQALKIMKELITENRKDYVIEIVKEITEGQKYASYGVYTPSKTAELGKFIFIED